MRQPLHANGNIRFDHPLSALILPRRGERHGETATRRFFLTPVEERRSRSRRAGCRGWLIFSFPYTVGWIAVSEAACSEIRAGMVPRLGRGE